jgi:AcrR family transcriptional regulator
MSPARAPNAAVPVADSRLADLRRAAAALFRERGVAGAGVDDIAGAVGLTGPAVYRYVDGKQALLDAVVAEFAGRVDRLVGQAPTMPDEAALRRVVAQLMPERDALAVALRQGPHASDIPPGLRDGASAWAALASRWAPDAPEPELRGRAAAGCLISLSFGGDTPDRLVEHGVGCVRRILEARLTAGTAEPAAEPRIAPRAETLRAFRREAILVRAAALFRQDGFNGVSLADIGAAVGITGSAVSRWFHTKEQLLVELFTRTGERLASSIFAAVDRSPDAAGAVVEVVRAYSAMAVDNRDLFLLNMHDQHHLPPAERRRRNRNQRVYIDELTHLVCAAHPGVAPLDARLRARAAFAGINEVLVSDGLLRRERLRDDLTSLGLAILLPAPPDP